MLTGDQEKIASLIAKEIGIDFVIANVVPSEKSMLIKNLKSHHKIMMVGDGINNTPSFVTADI